MSGSGWKEYLTFTRKERTGILVLWILIAIIYVVPELLPEKKAVKLYYNPDSLQHLATSKNFNRQEPGEIESVPSDNRPAIENRVSERFSFDPNTLDEKGWQQLGVNDRTIRTIMNFRTKGGQFRLPSDLRKIYGMNKNICEELIPFVSIQTRSSELPKRNDFKEHAPSIKPIDINLADSAEWEQLPAIGSKLASRIILFRTRLGGFYHVRQVAETFGISDSTFQIIFPYLLYTEFPVKKININEVAAPELAWHPYIRWTIANAIVNYRNQHGIFREVNDLKSVSVISSDLFEKLEPYLTVQ